MVLHTWDQLLNPHFHVHTLVPGGALADQGQTWKATKATYLFPVKALSTVFRAKYRDGLKGLYAEQALRFTGATLDLEAPRTFERFVKGVCQKKWVVYAKPPFGGPDQTLSYLGRYTHRVAISNHRLLDLQGDQIRFTFRNRQKDDLMEVAQLDAHTFIKRFFDACPSLGLRADSSLRPARQPLQSLHLALMQASPGPSSTTASAGAKERGAVDAAVDRHRHHALSGLWSSTPGVPPATCVTGR
jgi:hypothetical protein